MRHMTDREELILFVNAFLLSAFSRVVVVVVIVVEKKRRKREKTRG